MIDNLEEFTVKTQQINGVYMVALGELGLKKEHQETFIKESRNIFDVALEGFQGDPIQLYKMILQKGYYMLKKSRRNQISKHNKKLIRNRGNLVWNAKDGMKINED